MIDLLNLPGITPVDMEQVDGELVIKANTLDNNIPKCPQCDKPMHKHGRRTNVFADTPMQMQPTKIEISRQRYRCRECKTLHVPELPFLDEKRNATKRLIESLNERCLSKTFSSLAEDTGLAVNTVKGVATDFIGHIEANVRFETPTFMGIDEVMLAGDYRCVITNLGTHTMYDMLQHRTQDHLKPYFANLPDKEKVEWICTDMWRPFKRSFTEHLPNAKLVIDKFHVVKMASEALEVERKRYQSLLTKKDRLHVKKSLRWMVLKRPSELSPAETYELSVVRSKLPALGQAYDLKEAFYRIYDCKTKEAAQQAFDNWKAAVPREMKGFAGLVKTVHNHYDDIFAYWDAPISLTNGYTEAMNGVAKVANRMGRGYSYEVIRAKILYGKLARQIGSKVTVEPIQAEDVDDATIANFAFTKTLSFRTSPTKQKKTVIEYGAHIPTLVKMAEDGLLD